MLKNPAFAAIFTTVYLAVYCGLTQFEAAFNIAFAMFIFGPVLVLWVVCTVLKYGKYERTELGENEFGYQDKGNNELGVF